MPPTLTGYSAAAPGTKTSNTALTTKSMASSADALGGQSAVIASGGRTVTQKELTFLVTPPQVNFRDYEPFKEYKATISFKNQTHVTQDVRVVAPENRFFSLSAPKGASKTLKIAAGLSVSYTVTFMPEEEKDYSCELVCITESHQFYVPVVAMAARGTLDLPSCVRFENAPIKYQSEKTLYVRNTGRKPAQFSLSVTDPWRVLPSMCALEPQEAVQISVMFHPEEKKVYEGKLKIAYTNGDQQECELVGEVVDANIKLEKNTVVLPTTFISLERQEIVRLKNNSDITAKFCWKMHESIQDEDLADEAEQVISRTFSGNSILGKSSLKNTTQSFAEGNVRVFEHPVFTIEPLAGEIRARGVTEFVVTFNPQVALKYDTIAFLDVVGREARLPLHLSGTGAGPQCCFSYDAVDLGDVFINSNHIYEVLLENRGSIDARFQLQEQKTLFGSRFMFSPSFGLIPPGESQAIEIRFCSDIIGNISEAFMFEIKGATSQLPLHFKGNVIGPTFHFDVDELDFGQVAFNFVYHKNFHIINTSDIPMKYSLRVPEDGAGDKKEFTIVPASGSILPKGKQKFVVDFLANTVQEYHHHIVVDIEDVGANIDALPSRAICQMPQVSISRENLDFGQCFHGYAYSLPVELHNAMALPAKYEVLLPGPEDPVRRKLDIDSDPKKGVVSAKSGHTLTIKIVPRAVGGCHLPIYVKIPGSDKPHHTLSVTTKVIGPIVVPDPAQLDFGKVTVLTEAKRSITLANNSPIPATFVASLKGGESSVYSLPVKEVTIPPNSSTQFAVHAYLDEVMKFNEELILNIQHTGELPIKLIAIGKGNTIVPSIPLTGDVDFAHQFTTTKVYKTFVLANHGRRNIPIVWYNMRGSKLKEGDPPFTFFIQPERATVPPKSEIKFTIEGFSATAGKFQERFMCKVAQSQRVLFQPTVLGEFFVPLLQFSHPNLVFTYVYDKSLPPDAVLLHKPLTLKNVSPLKLDFTLKAAAPFVLDRTEYSGVGFGESVTVGIHFDASYRNDRVTHICKSKLTVIYKDHPQRDSIDLIGDVTFPNLSFETTTVDFGAVLNDTERSMTVKVTNCSKVDANFRWIFEEEDPRPAQPSSPTRNPLQSLAEGAVSPLPSSLGNVFDVLPTRGVLHPGESDSMRFFFHGHAQRKLRANATCRVEGGPDYPVAITGEASSIQFKVDKDKLDFGTQPYDKWEERELFLQNSGKVAFPFSIDLSTMVHKGCIQVTPSEGVVKGMEKLRLVVKFCSGIPDRVEDRFRVQVAHFDPQYVSVMGIGLYTSLYVELPRLNATLFQTYVERAKTNLAKADRRLYYLPAPEVMPPEGWLPSEMEVNVEAERLLFIDTVAEARRMESEVNAATTTGPTKNVVASADDVANSTSVIVEKRTIGSSSIAEQKIVIGRYIHDFGPIVKGESRKKTFRMMNPSLAPISYYFDKRVYNNAGITITNERVAKMIGHPTSPPLTLEVTIDTKDKAFELGDFHITIPLDIKGGPLILLDLKAHVLVPTLHLSTEKLDFGVVRVGKARMMTVQFHNQKPLPCEWSAAPREEKDKKKIVRCAFQCFPTRGVLAPGERANLTVAFVPIENGNSSYQIIVKMANNPKPVTLSCKGTGEDISVQILPPEMTLGPVLPFSNADVPFKICNRSKFAIEVFSLPFDNKYLIEDDILRHAEGYVNTPEGEVLWLPQRQPGEPLPEELLEHYYQYLLEEDSKYDALIKLVEDVPLPQLEQPEPLAPEPVVDPSQYTVVITGPPSSGKTTVANALAQKLVYLPNAPQRVITSPDAILEAIANGSIPCDMNLMQGAAQIISAATEAPEASLAVLVPAAPTVQATARGTGATPRAGGAGQVPVPVGPEPGVTVDEKLLTELLALGMRSLSDMQRSLMPTQSSKPNPIVVVIDGVESKYIADQEQVARCVFRASSGRQGLFHVELTVDAKLMQLRQAVVAEAVAEKEFNENIVEEIPEEVYDQLSQQEQATYQTSLTKMRLCKKKLMQATALRQQLEKTRAEALLQGPLATIADEIRQAEEEEKQRQEAELAAAKGGKKGAAPAAPKPAKGQSIEEPPKENLRTMDPLQLYKKFFRKVQQRLAGLGSGEGGTPGGAVPGATPNAPAGGAPRPPAKGSKKGAPVDDLESLYPPVPSQNLVVNGGEATIATATASALPASLTTFLNFLATITLPPPPKPVETSPPPLPIPSPYVRQRIVRPEDPVPRIPVTNFSILTGVWEVPPPPVDEDEGKKKKPAGGKNASPESARPPLDPVLVLKDGITRWILEAGETKELIMRFVSEDITAAGGKRQMLEFGVVGSKHEYPIECVGVCAYPELARDVRNVFTRRIKARPEDKFVHKQFVLSTKVFEFGPLLAGKKNDGYLTGAHPEHCETLRITNNGLYESSVQFCFEEEPSKVFFLDPREMTLAREETRELRIWAFPEKGGLAQNALVGLIKDNPEPMKFALSCFGSTPLVEVDGQKDKLIDFDRLLLRIEKTIACTLKNTAAIPVTWKFVNMEKLVPEFTISPCEGTLEPKQESQVSVTFKAEKAALFVCKMEMQISHAATKLLYQTIPFTFQAEGYDVYMETTKNVDFGIVKVSTPVTQPIQMLNRGKYDVAYQFKLSKKLAEVLKLVPQEGIVKPKEAMKVDLTFATKREITLQNAMDCEVRFTEPKNNELIGVAPMPISVRAFFSKYLLTPCHGLNFGPCMFNNKKTLSFEMANQGQFDIRFRLFSFKEGLASLPPMEEDVPQPHKKGGKPPATAEKSGTADKQKPGAKRGAKAPPGGEELTLGPFVISPTNGTIPVKGSTTITVHFNPEGNLQYHETLGLDLADRDPADCPNGVAYELEGESCIPGINGDLDSPECVSIFEEQQIVSRLDRKKTMTAVFARDDRVFWFGTVPADGRRATEKIKLVNPNKVPCTVQCKIRPRNESKDAIANAEVFDIKGCETAIIPPHEHRYVVIGFKPTALTNYAAIFEAIVEGGTDPKTKGLRFEVCGEGMLPQITLEIQPPPPNVKLPDSLSTDTPTKRRPSPDTTKRPAAGAATASPAKGKSPTKGGAPPVAPSRVLVFPRTIVEKQSSRWITVHNQGDLEAHIKFNFPINANFEFPNRGEDIVIAPRSSEKYNILFHPRAAGNLETRLTMIVPENRFEDATIAVVGEGFQDDLTFVDIDEGCEDRLTLGNCAMGSAKTKTINVVNHSDDVLRFMWVIPSGFSVVPQMGHLQPRSSKQVTVGVVPHSMPRPEASSGHLQIQFKKIRYTNPPADGGKVEWDNSMKSVRWTMDHDVTIETPYESPPLISETPDDLGPAKTGRKVPMKGLAARKQSKGGTLSSEDGSSTSRGATLASEAAAELLKEPSVAGGTQPSSRTARGSIYGASEAGGPRTARRSIAPRKVVETIPEPSYSDLSGGAPPKFRDLFVKCVIDYCRWAIPPATASAPGTAAAPNILNTGVRFRLTKMYQTRAFSFPFQNTSPVDMRYTWVIVNENGEPDMAPSPTTSEGGTVVSPPACPFTIEPATGVLGPNERMTLSLKYSPMDVDCPHERYLVGIIENLAPDATQPKIKIQGWSECPLVHFELQASDYLTSDRRLPEFKGPGSKLGNLDPTITQVIEMPSRGVKIRNTRRFYVLNPSDMSYEFEWIDITGDTAISSQFTCHTPRGVIHSGKKYEMVFDFTPETLDILECLYQLDIVTHTRTSIPFLLVGSAAEPDVKFDKPRLNFGSVLLASKARQTLTIINNEELPFAFAFDKVMDANQEGQSVVSVSPEAGTVAAHSTLAIEVTFCTSSEEIYNYNLVCRVKKKTTFLTCNIKGEGYSVHDTMVLKTASDAVVLQPGVPNKIDFGKVHINDTANQTLVLQNRGRYTIDYKWAVGPSSRFVSIKPDLGTVAKGENCEFDLAFHPTAETLMENAKVTCKITNGRVYTLLLNGTGSQPELHFSFKSFDFGSCFLKTAEPYQTTLVITNKGDHDIAFDVPWENREHLEVQCGASVLQKGEQKRVVITFMPKDIVSYSETIPFEINGLYTVPINITGEGCIPRIELANTAQKTLNIGMIRVGEVSKKTVKIVCKSKVSTPFSLANVDLSKYFITITPKAPQMLRPKQVLALEFTFAPQQRLRPFNEEVMMDVCGLPRPLLSVNGAGQGVELHLDTKTASFGPVVKGTTVTKRILLFNTGDLGVKFVWDLAPLGQDFSIQPVEGFVQAHNDVTIELTYHPTIAMKTNIIEGLQCRILPDQHHAPLLLNVNGQCVDMPPITETLKFQTNVRKPQVRQIKIQNTTGSNWSLRPQFDNESWSGLPAILEVKPQETVNFDITYNPSQMTKNRSADGTQPETGILFIPLPTGVAKLYQLEGIADPPTAISEISREVPCKVLHTEKVVVTNWLKKPQKFKVSRSFATDAIIKGLDEIDVPAQASRDYKFTFLSHKDTQVKGTVTFTNEETKEYIFYNVSFKTLPPTTIDTISLRAPVRQKANHELTIENPLSDKPVTLTVKCDSPDITTVPPTLTIPPSGEGKLTVVYFPLVVKTAEQTTKLALSCPELGMKSHS